MTPFDERRAVQALGYITNKAVGRTITKLVALKLVYLADRYHLRKYGRTILGDNYVAMRYGPVASHTKDLIEKMAQTGSDVDGYLTVVNVPGGRSEIRPALPPDTSMLSDTEMESFDAAVKLVYLYDLVELTHQFPEWRRHEDELASGRASIPMDYADFFLPCDVPGAEYCDAPSRLVEINRELYAESRQCLP